MIDFITSLNKGFELAQQADENNKEIDAVFAELNRQLHEVYSGQLMIQRRVSTNKIEVINAVSNSTIQPDYKVIVARNRKSKSLIDTAILIANWEQSATGYPCSITFSGQKHICEDKEALELAISELLTDPFVAKTLLKVINMELESIE